MMLLFYMVSLPWLHIILLSKLFMNETYDTGEGTGAGLFYWGCEALRVLLQLIGLGRRAGHICESEDTQREREM